MSSVKKLGRASTVNTGVASVPRGQSELSEGCVRDTLSPGSQPFNRPRSFSRLRQLVDPPIKEGMLSAPPFRSACVGQPNRRSNAPARPKNRCRGNDQERQCKEWLHSGVHRPLSQHHLRVSEAGELPPPQGSGYPARTNHVDSPTKQLVLAEDELGLSVQRLSIAELRLVQRDMARVLDLPAEKTDDSPVERRSFKDRPCSVCVCTDRIEGIMSASSWIAYPKRADSYCQFPAWAFDKYFLTQTNWLRTGGRLPLNFPLPTKCVGKWRR